MKVFTALMVSMLIVPGVNGQEITFRDTIQKLIDRVSTSLAYPGQVKQFYSLHAARRVWVTNAPAQRLLLQYLDSAAYFGLRPEDYHYDFMLSWRNETSSPADESLLTAEVFFTDAALHFFHDIHMGNEKPPMTYDGLNFVPDWSAIPAQLASALQFGSLHQLLQAQAARFDTLVQKGMEQQQQPTLMTLAEKVPVLVLYNTAWFDAKGNVAFFDDVYRKFR